MRKDEFLGIDNQGRPYCKRCGKVFDTEAQVVGHRAMCKGISIKRLGGGATTTTTTTNQGELALAYNQLETRVRALEERQYNQLAHLSQATTSPTVNIPDWVGIAILGLIAVAFLFRELRRAKIF